MSDMKDAQRKALEEKMDLDEFLNWYDENWESVKDTNHNVITGILRRKSRRTFGGMEIGELLQWGADNTDWFDWPIVSDTYCDAMKVKFPFNQIFERLKRIEIALGTVLRHMEDVPADISVAALNRLKGGYQRSK